MRLVLTPPRALGIALARSVPPRRLLVARALGDVHERAYPLGVGFDRLRLGEVVGRVGGALDPLDDELALLDPVLDPVPAQVDGLGLGQLARCFGEAGRDRVVRPDGGRALQQV